MNRYLITGFSGFVGSHFLHWLESQHKPVSIVGMDVAPPDFDIGRLGHVQCDFERLDLLDRVGIEKILRHFQPDYLLHLASYSSVAYSWRNPVQSFQNNTNIFLNILDAVHHVDPSIRILSVGSSEEYGTLAEGKDRFAEEDTLHPVSPYAVARVSQEMLSRVYSKGYGLDIVMTRSFNHVGPGQKDIFVVPSFTKRLLEMKRQSARRMTLVTGDISVIRDFVDVRDVVRAYDGLLHRGRKGEIYNVCSGVGHSLKDVIDLLAAIIGIEIETQGDVKLIRPDENKVIVGSYEKIRRDIGWMPQIPLTKSLQDVVAFWQ